MDVFVWHEPKMTSNTTPAPFVASASSTRYVDREYKAFDGKTAADADGWYSAANSGKSWVQIDFGEKINVNKMEITGAISIPTGSPKDFQLLGSNNGADFITLSSFTNITGWTKNQKRSFDINNTEEFRYYRLNIDSSNGYIYNIVGDIKLGGMKYFPAIANIEFYNSETNTKITTPLSVTLLKNGSIYSTHSVLTGFLQTEELDINSTWEVKTVENSLYNALKPTVFTPSESNPTIKLNIDPVLNKTFKFYYDGESTLTKENVKLKIYRDGALFLTKDISDGQYTEAFYNGSYSYEVEGIYGVYNGIPKTPIDISNSNDIIVNLEVFTQTNKTLILHDGEYKKYYTGTPIILGGSLVPNMTSHTKPSGLVEASSEQSTNTAWRAFSSTGYWTAVSGNDQWISYEFPQKEKVAKYIIDCSNLPVRAPRDFSLQYYDEILLDWVVIDRRTNEIGWDNVGVREYTVPQDKMVNALKYRVYVEVGNNNSYLTFAKLEFHSQDTPATLPSWSIVSSTLPTSTQFIGNGMDSLTPLLDRRVETLEPLKMTDKSEILQESEVGKVFSKKISLKRYLDIKSVILNEKRKVIIQIDKPTNVSLSMNTSDYTQGTVSWNNPTNDTIAEIIVAYSYTGYPTEASMETIAYQGSAIQEIELTGLELNKKIYVSVFIKNEETVSFENAIYEPIKINSVTAASASYSGSTMSVRWTNPTNTEVEKIMVRYSATSYPTATSGSLAYEGVANSCSFSGFTAGKTVYISIFAYGKNGTVSSQVNTMYEFIVIDPVKNLLISNNNGSYTATWTNPTNTSLSKVVARYSFTEYPTASSGTQIYSGTGASVTFTPPNTTTSIQTIYVTVIAYGVNGTISEGANMTTYMNALSSDDLMNSATLKSFGTYDGTEGVEKWIPGVYGLKINTRAGVEEVYSLINLSYNLLTSSEKTTVSASSGYKNMTNTSAKNVTLLIADICYILDYTTFAGMTDSQIKGMEDKAIAARTAFTPLPLAHKLSVPNITALAGIENKISKLKAQKIKDEEEAERQRAANNVINKINELDSMIVGSTAYKNAVKSARSIFDSLPLTSKLLVTNLEKLVEHEKNI